MKCFRYGVVGLCLFVGGIFVGANVSAKDASVSTSKPASASQTKSDTTKDKKPPKAQAIPESSTGTPLPPGYTIREANTGKKPYEPIFEGSGVDRGIGYLGLVSDNNISKEKSLIKLMAAWLRFALPIIAFLAVVAIIYAGYTYVTGGGDDGRYDKAKSIVIWVVIGLIVVLAAYAIVNTVITGFVTGTEPAGT